MAGKQIGKYEIGRPLGEGQFGKVKEAVDLETGHRYAVKIITKEMIKSNKDVEAVKREVNFMRMLDHPNILKMYDTLEDTKKLYLVLEIANGGDLFDKIIATGGFSEEVARMYFKQVIDGVHHCHNKGIVHRDLKPENLLLASDEQLKISDFGLSNIITTPEQMLKTHCGSEKYAAPEVMANSDPYMGLPVDMWSCGVILYIMVGGAFPFVEATVACELFQSLKDGKFAFPKQFSSELVDLLLRMFTIDPKDRATVDEVKQHMWLNPTDGLLDGPTSMCIDEEPVYRTLQPDMISMSDAVYFEEEPVYRSIQFEPSTSEASNAEPAKNCKMGFACRPTAEFSCSHLSAAQMMKDVAALLESSGAQIKVKEEKGQIKAEVQGESGEMVKARFLVSEQQGKTSLAVKRAKGHALDYAKMFMALRPAFANMCDQQ